MRLLRLSDRLDFHRSLGSSLRSSPRRDFGVRASAHFPKQRLVIEPNCLTDFYNILFSGTMSGVRAILQLTTPSGEQLLLHTLYVLGPCLFICTSCSLVCTNKIDRIHLYLCLSKNKVLLITDTMGRGL